MVGFRADSGQKSNDELGGVAGHSVEADVIRAWGQLTVPKIGVVLLEEVTFRTSRKLTMW